ncbi:hypothetical protein A4G99_20450 [Haladaptatus sp. R4]|nr:hypothetical protein A4G99_20450 [Haladaptatus sp. R4]
MELIDTIRTLFSDLQRDSNDSYFTVSAATPKSSSGSKPTNASNTSKTSSDGTSKAEWRSVESPTDKTLIGVTTTTEGPFAVGTGGNVLTKRDGEWRFAIRDGPATRENTLTCVDVTDDGTRIWFAGSSGALGCYDATEGKKYDYSAPKEKTSTWEAIAVSGNAGSELIRVANGSGEVLPVTVGEHGCRRGARWSSRAAARRFPRSISGARVPTPSTRAATSSRKAVTEPRATETGTTTLTTVGRTSA